MVDLFNCPFSQIQFYIIKKKYFLVVETKVNVKSWLLILICWIHWGKCLASRIFFLKSYWKFWAELIFINKIYLRYFSPKFDFLVLVDSVPQWSVLVVLYLLKIPRGESDTFPINFTILRVAMINRHCSAFLFSSNLR